jgi:hypothetical protein
MTWSTLFQEITTARERARFTRRNQMEPRRLGKQGLTVSVMGLGCMGLSDAYGRV